MEPDINLTQSDPSYPAQPDPPYPAQLLVKGANAMMQRAVLRDAQDTGERSMLKTVNIFNAYKGAPVLSEEDGWIFMVFLKLVRGSQGQYHEDDYVDGAAYVALLGECSRDNRV